MILTVGSIIKSGIEQTNGTIYISGFNGTFVMDIVSNADSYVIVIEENLDSISEFPFWVFISVLLIGSFALVVFKKYGFRIHSGSS